MVGQFRQLQYAMYGHLEFVGPLRHRGKFFDQGQRERDLALIHGDDPARPVYGVTAPSASHNEHEGLPKHVVFLVNGIPVLAIECHSAESGETGGGTFLSPIAKGLTELRRRGDSLGKKQRGGASWEMP